VRSAIDERRVRLAPELVEMIEAEAEARAALAAAQDALMAVPNLQSG
jgi:hypothetical protein